ncbi:putative kinetochore protein SPC24 [Porphyridium purpureum]|uniref:Kinetochore protein Spc24 n=1 Tax=Porphyridium purpureum TaxID=35688 RepID=A0A5J4YYH2_PORPP|nr:putative kinetochore protein SPC24 [Porphyridium purpureum]|eukprot:POR4833..scf209_3
MGTPSGRTRATVLSPAAPPSVLKANGALEDTAALIDDITALFETNEDVQQVEALASTLSRIEQLSCAQLDGLAQQLRTCEQRLEQARAAAAGVETEEEHANRMRALEREKAQIIQHILELEEEAAASRASLSELKSELLNKAGAQETGRTTLESELMQREKKLDLYVRLSGIRFDLTTPAPAISGYVSDQPHRRVHAFDFPRVKQDPYEDVDMANYLWDLIDQATA